MRSLYPYQEEGVRFLVGRDRAYLNDGMGLGKTIQAAAAARVLQERGHSIHTCVVCPASARENWTREWAEWGPRGQVFGTVSYTALANNPHAAGGDWDLVILDEAHYAKNPRAKRTQAALNLARGAGRAWCLSGTPMPNHPGELWPVVRALWPGITRRLGLDRYQDWYEHFVAYWMGEYGPRPYGTKNADTLRSVVQEIMLGRELEDIELELPPLRLDLHLLPRRSVTHPDLQARVDREAARDDHWASTSRLRRYLGELKAPQVAKALLEELGYGQYQQVVVLAYHKSVLSVLREKLAPFGVVGFDGGTPGPARQEAVDAFREDPTNRVFLAQQTAAGVAINLQTASEVVLVEPAWSPDDNRQAIKRIHRIGQTRPCRARVFAIQGTLDEAIMASVARKTLMQEEVGL